MVVASLGCDAGVPRESARPAGEKPSPAAAVTYVDAYIAKPRFEIAIEEIAVDRPLYPIPRGFRPRRDAQAIMEDVERAVRRELDRITACVNEPKSAAIGLGWTIAPGGRALDVSAHASLTSPGQDPARDRCIADVIRTIVFAPPGRVAPIEMALWVRTDD